jgi:hypothetical protein
MGARVVVTDLIFSICFMKIRNQLSARSRDFFVQGLIQKNSFRFKEKHKTKGHAYFELPYIRSDEGKIYAAAVILELHLERIERPVECRRHQGIQWVKSGKTGKNKSASHSGGASFYSHSISP